MPTYYAQKVITDAGVQYSDIYTSLVQLRLSGVRDPVVVHLEEHPDGEYYGWLDKNDNYYSMIFPNWKLFNMCFAYGSAAAVEKGEGRIVRLRITEPQRDAHEES